MIAPKNLISHKNTIRQSFYTKDDVGFHHPNEKERRAVYTMWNQFTAYPVSTVIEYQNRLKSICEIFQITASDAEQAFIDLEGYEPFTFSLHPERYPRAPTKLDKLKENYDKEVLKALSYFAAKLHTVKETSHVKHLVNTVSVKFDLGEGDLRKAWNKHYPISIEAWVMDYHDGKLLTLNESLISNKSPENKQNIIKMTMDLISVMPHFTLAGDVTKSIFSLCKRYDVLQGDFRKIWCATYGLGCEKYWQQNYGKNKGEFTRRYSETSTKRFHAIETDSERAWRLLTAAIQQVAAGETVGDFWNQK